MLFENDIYWLNMKCEEVFDNRRKVFFNVLSKITNILCRIREIQTFFWSRKANLKMKKITLKPFSALNYKYISRKKSYRNESKFNT